MVPQKRTPWVDRARAIKEKYPHSATLDWYGIFTDDPAILGNLINDILKLDQSRAGKPGKRPSLTEASTSEKLKKIQDTDHTEHEFLQAFKNLCGERSVRAIAAKTELDKSYVHRLMTGSAIPSSEIMGGIAVSFGKHPSYFLEHRINYILSVLKEKLIGSPESSVVFYNKISGDSEKNR